MTWADLLFVASFALALSAQPLAQWVGRRHHR